MYLFLLNKNLKNLFTCLVNVNIFSNSIPKHKPIMYKSVLLSFIQKSSTVQYRSYAVRKRFYKATSVINSGSNWEVTLDHRRLKTPNGMVLTVPSEPLARAIAAEWDSQTETISQPTMHLTALCNTSLDNPGKLNVHDITSYLIDYLATDTLLFYSDEEGDLRALQEQKWGDILKWFEHRFNVKQKIAFGLEPPPVTAETRAVLARYFLSYDFPSLNAMCFGAEALKSPLLMIACTERRVDPREAVMLARLEEEYQLHHWGKVPWAHELNQAELTARVAASVLFIHAHAEHYTTKAKAQKKT